MNSLFYKSLKLAKEKYRTFLLILAIDMLFFASIYFINSIAKSFLLAVLRNSIRGIIFLIVYIGLVLAAYSFFKYAVLHFIRSMGKKEKFSLNRLRKFSFLNIIIFAIALLIYFALSGFIYFMVNKQDWVFVGMILGIPFALFFYALINITNSLFALGSSNPLKEGLNFVFKKTNEYMGVYINILVFALIYAVLSLFKAKILLFVVLLLGYAVFSFNRVYFYEIVKK